MPEKRVKNYEDWREHYDEAERLLAKAETVDRDEWGMFYLAQAQVHATLAVTKREDVDVQTGIDNQWGTHTWDDTTCVICEDPAVDPIPYDSDDETAGVMCRKHLSEEP